MEPEPEKPLVEKLAVPSTTTAQRTILFADMADYSRWMGVDEAGTLEFMSGCFDTIRILARRFNGTLVKTLGDGALLLFEDSALSVAYSIEFHRIVEKVQRGVSEPFRFRVGIHHGEVTLRSGDVFGYAVNVAARLQTQAAQGCSIISQNVYAELGADPEFELEAIGSPFLKNIKERIQLYRVVDPNANSQRELNAALPVLQVMNNLGMGFDSHNAESPTDKLSKCVLGYLALCPGKAETFERLSALIWPNRQVRNTGAVLRDIMYRIEQELSPSFDILITSQKSVVALDRMKFDIDLELLDQQVRSGQVPDRLLNDPEWPSHILSGTDNLNPMYDTWLKVTRANWTRRILKSLEVLLKREAEGSSVYRDAADAILLLEPGNEMASLGRISHFLAHNIRSSAFEEFDRLEQFLSATYGTTPSERIRKIVEEERQNSEGRANLSQSDKADRNKRFLRIAVDAFQCGPNVEIHRVTAFRSDLLINLSCFRDWSIIDIDREKAGSRDDDLAANENIDYRINADAALVDSTIHISLRLEVFQTNRVIWSERFELDTKNWIAAQRAILNRIAATIEIFISTDRLYAAVSGKYGEETTHDVWLRGYQEFMHWTPEGAEKADKIFSSIIEQDPTHAPSLASLANISNVQHIIRPGFHRSPTATVEADQRASLAAEIDPMDARNQRVVAWAAALNCAYDRASLHFDLATSLNPSDPATLSSCAMGYAWLGEHDKSAVTITQLLSITQNLPSWIWSYLASTYFFLDRLEDALRAAELADDSIVDNQGWVAAIHARLNNGKLAKMAFARLVDQVTQVWVGDVAPTSAQVYEWFTHAFPIRSDVDRKRLSDALAVASGAE